MLHKEIAIHHIDRIHLSTVAILVAYLVSMHQLHPEVLQMNTVSTKMNKVSTKTTRCQQKQHSVNNYL